MKNNIINKVNETNLDDEINITETASRIIEEITPFMTGVFEVSDIKRARYAEIFEAPGDDSADRFFRAKRVFITLDEKSGKEKKSSQNLLIQAADRRDAIKRLDEGMKGSMMDYTIASVTETAIMDIFHYVQAKRESYIPEQEQA